MFNDEISSRAAKIAEYVVATGATVRASAKHFGISKSTVHKDLTERLKHTDNELYANVCAVLARNRAERHLRGGAATKRKYVDAREKANLLDKPCKSK